MGLKPDEKNLMTIVMTSHNSEQMNSSPCPKLTNSKQALTKGFDINGTFNTNNNMERHIQSQYKAQVLHVRANYHNALKLVAKILDGER